MFSSLAHLLITVLMVLATSILTFWEIKKGDWKKFKGGKKNGKDRETIKRVERRDL